MKHILLKLPGLFLCKIHIVIHSTVHEFKQINVQRKYPVHVNITIGHA